jgi:UDP-glucose:(heptosyl)LPS alpha-1,3-glucosyltransferase
VSDRQGIALVWPVAANTGGVELIAREVLEHFVGRRPTTFVGTSMSPPVDGVRHVRVESSPGNVRRPVSFRRASQRALRELDPADVVISMGANCAPAAVRWVHSVHAAFLRMPGRLQLGPVEVSARWRYALPRHQALLALERSYFQQHPPSLVLATSEREREDLVELYDVSEHVVHVIGNGYNPDRFSPNYRHRVRDGVRNQLGIGPDQLSVVFAANELHRKGFSVLLRALSKLRRADVRVDVVGKADPAAVVAAAAKDGWVPEVRWHGRTQVIEQFYAAGDLLVLPTHYEPFGLVIVEALATGLPVVTSRIAGASSYVTPAAGRLQERSDDVDELAELLHGCLDRSVLDAMSAAAPGAVRELEWPRLFDRIERLVTRD